MKGTDKEFVMCFDDDNHLIIRELPIDIRGVLLMDFELSSSQDKHGSEWVEELEEMNWIDEEVQMTLVDHDWQLPSCLEALGNKYGN